jgi:hypothetical protein
VSALPPGVQVTPAREVPSLSSPSPAAGLSAPATPPLAAGRARLEFTEEDLRILDSIDRMAAGAEELAEVEKVRPARMVASLVRLLIRKGVIHELEFLEELTRK